jgi:predicted Fe-S protein YdhL (DUF1289 family)
LTEAADARFAWKGLTNAEKSAVLSDAGALGLLVAKAETARLAG